MEGVAVGRAIVIPLNQRWDQGQGSCRMPDEICYSDEAIVQLKKLRTFDRTAILDQVEQVLTVNPPVESKAGVKRLREPVPTQFRLRVGEFRVHYDVEGDVALIAQILSKQDSKDYLGGLS
jgi:mRNA-degrading endonuclease RelE of RelBE toxin-antitoxin system